LDAASPLIPPRARGARPLLLAAVHRWRRLPAKGEPALVARREPVPTGYGPDSTFVQMSVSPFGGPGVLRPSVQTGYIAPFPAAKPL